MSVARAPVDGLGFDATEHQLCFTNPYADNNSPHIINSEQSSHAIAAPGDQGKRTNKTPFVLKDRARSSAGKELSACAKSRKGIARGRGNAIGWLSRWINPSLLSYCSPLSFFDGIVFSF
jgi:hypothetical protein